MVPDRFKDFWRGYRGLRLATLTRTNRRVQMLEQPIAALLHLSCSRLKTAAERADDCN